MGKQRTKRARVMPPQANILHTFLQALHQCPTRHTKLERAVTVVWGVSHTEDMSSLVAGNSRHCDNHNHLTNVQRTPCFLPKVLGLA